MELPAFPETDASFAEAKARIAKPLDLIKGFGPAQIDGTGEKDISWKAGERPMSFKGQAYLLHFCLPHFFFHCTTAYNILRLNGVELGTRDYMAAAQQAAWARAARVRRKEPVFRPWQTKVLHSVLPSYSQRNNSRRWQLRHHAIDESSMPGDLRSATMLDVCSMLAEAGPDSINDRHIRVVPTCFENGGAGQATAAPPIL